jgi:hypothetical protein
VDARLGFRQMDISVSAPSSNQARKGTAGSAIILVAVVIQTMAFWENGSVQEEEWTRSELKVRLYHGLLSTTFTLTTYAASSKEGLII